MNILELKEKFKFSEWSYAPNKVMLEKNYLPMDQIEFFNEVYRYCLKHYHEVSPTPAGGIPNSNQYKNVQRFFVIPTPVGFELVIISFEGVFRFILRNGKVKEDNTISGSKALREIFSAAEEFQVLDIFKKYATDKETGLQIKKSIESPIIATFKPELLGHEFENVHHIDFNSSYASRIIETHPELASMYKFLYSKRKENDGYYKHCLTNSIGMMQSKHCIDVYSGYTNSPYQLSHFAKVAINGTNEKIYEYLMSLELSGRRPLLINTDGIWYSGAPFHDKREGLDICQWKHDHQNCRLYIKSAGAYQYIEDGTVHSVVRGYTSLDQIKPRSEWGWREIDTNNKVYFHKFIKGQGVEKVWEERT